jgi:hypothetical protein
MASTNFNIVCVLDDQDLVRALYTRHTEPGSKLQKLGKLADPDPPDPKEIEMLVLNVSSRAIARFLGELTGNRFNDIIKVGTPFRPIVRNLGRIRDHFLKLEGLYG